MSDKIDLFRDGSRIGTAKAHIIESWQITAGRWIFPKVPGGLDFYRQQLPIDAKAPILIFDDLTIFPAHRQQGLGSAGMLATMRHFRKFGARTAFLRVGTQCDDWESGKIWREEMYRKPS